MIAQKRRMPPPDGEEGSGAFAVGSSCTSGSGTPGSSTAHTLHPPRQRNDAVAEGDRHGLRDQ